MTTFEARIEIVDDGFFYPIEVGRREQVDSHGFHHVGVAGLSVSVQFVRTAVYLLPDGLPYAQLVIWAHHPRIGDEAMVHTDQVLRSTFLSASVSFVLEAHRSSAHAWTSDARPSRASVAAIGAAHCFGTLDDLDVVTVHLAGTAYSVRMRHGSGAWLASVSTVDDPPAARGGQT